MKLKFDDKGAVVVQDGKPVYVMDDGREVAHDAAATVAKISQLNGEARTHREAKEAAETKLKAYEGIDDAEAARRALQTVANLSSGELKTAAQVQEITEAANRSAREAVAEATRTGAAREKAKDGEIAKLTGQINSLVIGSAFAGSKFVKEKMVIPADIAQKVFGDRFKVDNGKLVPLDKTGNPLFSATNHGDHADIDEALHIMVNEYPNKEMILRASGASGGGSSGGGAARGAGNKTMLRSQFLALPPAEQAAQLKAGVIPVDA